MKKLFLFILFAVAALFMGCKKPEAPKAAQESVHRVEALEIIDVTSYTYLRVKENEKEYWIAGPKMNAEKGAVYFYKNGDEMKNFESPELKRTFESVIFVQGLSTQPPGSKPSSGDMGMGKQPQRPTLNKESVSVDKAPGGVTIAEMFSGMKKYENKNIKIRGKVTKVNNAIMGKNWVHIQDGTEEAGNFDLTVTTSEMLNIGDIALFEGRIALNKDFGYGYSYKILLEDAKLLK